MNEKAVPTLTVQSRHSDYGPDAGGYSVLKFDGNWVGRIDYRETGEKLVAYFAALQAEVETLRGEVAELREWEECAKQLDRAKLPCGHNARYANTEDDGKHGFCTLCEVARLSKSKV